MLKAYVNFWGGYFTLQGQTSRFDYWITILINLLINLVVGVLAGIFILLGQGDPRLASLGATLAIGLFCYGLVSIIPSFTMEIRRLHDTGRSGWWWLIQFVPLIGSIWLLILTILPSKDNQ